MNWILCSERLPDSDGKYTVTIHTKYDDMVVHDVIYKVENKTFYSEILDDHGNGVRTSYLEPICKNVRGLIDREVTAWMPQPEPYRE